MILQLNPAIPVYIPSRQQEGYAIALIDYSQEHFTLWKVALENGEIWDIPQSGVRLQKNISMGRDIANGNLTSKPP